MLVIKASPLLVLPRCCCANDDDDVDVDGMDKQQRDEEVDFFAALALCWHTSCETVVATEKVAADILFFLLFTIVFSLSLELFLSIFYVRACFEVIVFHKIFTFL